jgi:hypothetical protein
MSRTNVAHLLLILTITVPALATGCASDGASTVKIAPVESPVDTLPPLPERAQIRIVSFEEFLPQVEEAKRALEELGGKIDSATNGGYLDCQAYFDRYHELASLPIADGSSAGDLAQWAGEQHEEAVSHALDRARDLYNHCSAALTGTADHDIVPLQEWGLARMGIGDALGTIEQTIARLQQDLPDSTDTSTTRGKIVKAINDARRYMDQLGWQVDKQFIVATDFVEAYDNLSALPTFDVSHLDPLTQYAYANYREAVDSVLEMSRDLHGNAVDFVASEQARRPVHRQQWGLSRMGVAKSVELLDETLRRLAEEEQDTTDYTGPNGPLLKAAKEAVTSMDTLAWELDKSVLTTAAFADAYEALEALPDFDPASFDIAAQGLSIRYLDAVDHVLENTHDLYLSVKLAIEDGVEEGRAGPDFSPFQVDMARKALVDSLDELKQVIRFLEQTN